MAGAQFQNFKLAASRLRKPALEESLTALRQIMLLAALVTSGPAMAQYTDGLVKIGVLTDMSGPYSELAGPGSVAAARLAVQDFDAAAKGIKVEIISGETEQSGRRCKYRDILV